MPEYQVDWSKTYYASGTVTVDAESTEAAKQMVLDNIGNYEGSMQYDSDQDYVENIREKIMEE